MNHAKLAAATVLTGSLLWLSACKAPDPVKAPYTPGQDLVGRTNYPKVTTTGDLAPWLVVAEPTVTHEGVLKVVVPVRLTSDTYQWSKVQYRFLFLDAKGTPVRAQPDWMPVTMEPRQQVFMQGNSLDSDATDWRLEIRPQH
jgi:uncharacterized protein YcfL